METLKRHLPVPVPEGLIELQKIASRFEEKIYNSAFSQVISFPASKFCDHFVLSVMYFVCFIVK